jgi:hypothetical protein
MPEGQIILKDYIGFFCFLLPGLCKAFAAARHARNIYE